VTRHFRQILLKDSEFSPVFLLPTRLSASRKRGRCPKSGGAAVFFTTIIAPASADARSHQLLPCCLCNPCCSNAIDYALGPWATLQVYLNDGRVEIDSNLVENAIRPTAIGKKNWLFVGEADAGERSAILYTIIESCRRRGIDSYAYLRQVLTRLPQMTNRQIPEVIPAAWSKVQVQRQLS
jgi:hypothetical protein